MPMMDGYLYIVTLNQKGLLCQLPLPTTKGEKKTLKSSTIVQKYEIKDGTMPTHISNKLCVCCNVCMDKVGFTRK